MNLKPLFNPFSQYADQQEKKVDQFLLKINRLGVFELQRNLLDLMQENLVVLNLWLEYKFRGYRYLTKKNRKIMYQNTALITKKFLHWEKNLVLKNETIELIKNNFNFNLTPADQEKLIYLVKICQFLSGKNIFGKAVTGQMTSAEINEGTSAETTAETNSKFEQTNESFYQYLEGASFGKLLVNIEQEPMLGDCNQIVTFYAYLYSLKYDLKDLQIKLPPEHACLHFKGIDIEATNGSLQKYPSDLILPITELISTNLLDISDYRDQTNEIRAIEFLKGARLAFNISSKRELVEKNLKIAYHNAGLEASRRADFANAILLFEKAENTEVIAQTFQNAIIHFVKNNNFKLAERYFQRFKNHQSSLKGYINVTELEKYLFENYALKLLKEKNYLKARKLAVKAQNQALIKQSYIDEYNFLQKKVAGKKTLAELKSSKNTYRKMLEIALKIGDNQLIENLRNILRQI